MAETFSLGYIFINHYKYMPIDKAIGNFYVLMFFVNFGFSKRYFMSFFKKLCFFSTFCISTNSFANIINNNCFELVVGHYSSQQRANNFLYNNKPLNLYNFEITYVQANNLYKVSSNLCNYSTQKALNYVKGKGVYDAYITKNKMPKYKPYKHIAKPANYSQPLQYTNPLPQMQTKNSSCKNIYIQGFKNKNDAINQARTYSNIGFGNFNLVYIDTKNIYAVIKESCGENIKKDIEILKRNGINASILEDSSFITQEKNPVYKTKQNKKHNEFTRNKVDGSLQKFSNDLPKYSSSSWENGTIAIDGKELGTVKYKLAFADKISIWLPAKFNWPSFISPAMQKDLKLSLLKGFTSDGYVKCPQEIASSSCSKLGLSVLAQASGFRGLNEKYAKQNVNFHLAIKELY